jgi:lipoprotein-anchoring transpeptidase ErfK/SrfK
MWRSGVFAAMAVFVAVSDAEAQSNRKWVPWQEIGGSSPSFGSTAPSRGAPKPQQRNDNNSGYSYSPFAGSPIAAPKSAVQFPSILDGGARPNISPAAPQTVAFRGFGQGEVIIDTQGRALYYVLSSTSAYRYPISVGREGFTWRGTEKISRVADWPDWRPPVEMRQRDPRLPELMYGGVNNPLGARALYLGNTLYRIHGTNDSRTIGYAASSGCFRMMNQHVAHLSQVAGVGTTVRVLDRLPSNVAGIEAPQKPQQVAPTPKKRSVTSAPAVPGTPRVL